jgi:hypothetical protein
MTDSPHTEPSEVKAATGPVVSRTALLNAALAKFQAELPYIEADETADAGTYSYKYADLAQVSSKVLPLLGKHGLAFTAFPTINAAGKFVLRYELLHASGEHKEGEYPITGGNAQAIGSSITYARRYCLSAVTGVAPADDDDAAAATQQKQTEFPTEPTDLDQAKQRVLAAWNFQYGTFVQAEAEASYRTWSDGGALTSADPAELRRFAAYLSNLPKEDAGSDPAGATAPPADAPPTEPQRKMIMAELKRRYPDRQDQLTWLRSVLGREIESRTEITYADAKTIIDVFESEGTGPR